MQAAMSQHIHLRRGDVKIVSLGSAQLKDLIFKEMPWNPGTFPVAGEVPAGAFDNGNAGAVTTAPKPVTSTDALGKGGVTTPAAVAPKITTPKSVVATDTLAKGSVTTPAAAAPKARDSKRGIAKVEIEAEGSRARSYGKQPG